MSHLVDILKSDHKELLHILEETKKLGSTQAGLAKLRSAKATLMAHLKLEDTSLYPELWKAAKTDPALREMLNTFAKEMEAITDLALAFFAKYETGQTGVNFAKDFGRLIGELNKRIRREETLLYEAYDRLKLPDNFKKRRAS